MSIARSATLSKSLANLTSSTKVLLPSPPAPDNFGRALALSGNQQFLLVGSSKRAVVYEKQQGQWIHRQDFEHTLAGFGTAVAISMTGEYIAISAPDLPVEGELGQGGVLVYRYSDNRWSLISTLRPSLLPHPSTAFGTIISMDADAVYLLAGRYFGTISTADIYKRSVDDFIPFNTFTEAGSTQLGRSVCMSQDGYTAALSDNNASKIYTYRRNSDDWTGVEPTIAFPEESVASLRMGWSIVMSRDGSVLASGCYSAALLFKVYVFRLVDGQWKQLGILELSDPTTNDQFGFYLAIDASGEKLLIGGPGRDDDGADSGAVYSCAISANELGELKRLPWPDPNAGAKIGTGLAISADGKEFFLGAPAANHSGANKGAVFIISSDDGAQGNGINPTVPGVYALESNQPLLAIPAGVTAIPLFIGVFRDKFGELLSNGSCIGIANFSDFRRRFGPSQSTTVTLTNGVPRVEDSADLGSLALQLYFDNGGGRCYILPLHDQTNPTELAAMVSKIRRCPEITLYVVTERLDTQTDKYHPACDALDPLLRNVGDGFLIADSYDGEHRPTTTDQRTAVYYPALETAYSARAADEDIEVVGFESENDERVTLAQVKAQDQDLYETISEALDTHYVGEKGIVRLLASAAVAGVYCRTDATLGIWHAPAGPSLNNVRTLYPRPKLAVVDKLIDNRINRLYDAPGEGVRVWGARTQEAPELPLWLHINVSRLFDAAARDIKRALQVAVFMPNNAITWNTVRNAINAYLYQLWRDGGLRGATSDEAYYVQIGNETMSAEDLLEGRLIVHVGLAALRPVEFIEVVFSQVLNAA